MLFHRRLYISDLFNLMAMMVPELDISSQSPIGLVFQKTHSSVILALLLCRQCLSELFPSPQPLFAPSARSVAQPATPPCAQHPPQTHTLSSLQLRVLPAPS